MIATIINNNHIVLDHMTSHEESLVAEEFTVTVTNRFIDPSDGGFNGIYRRYDRTNKRLARPFLDKLRKMCKENDVPLVVEDNRPQWECDIIQKDQINADFLPGITLEQYQVDAIRASCDAEVGIYDIVTGGGKTEVMAGICKAIRCQTVILADQRIVIDQIKQRLELRDVVDEVGLFYAGRTPDGQLIVAGSVQSLQIPTRVPPSPQESDAYRKARSLINNDREHYGLTVDSDRADVENAINTLADKIHTKAMDKYQSVLKGFRKRKERAKEFQKLVKQSDMLLVDESDMASSNQYKNVFRHLFSGRRRYGFSGTPFDPDKPVDALFIHEHLGSVIIKVDRNTLESLGRIIPVTFTMLALGDTKNERSAYDIAVREKMVENNHFHRAIAAICRRYSGDQTLILVDRDLLGEALANAIDGAIFINGKTTKRRQDQVLRAFERKELRVVIGGKIIRRGLDLKGGCDNLIIATGGKLWSTFNQQIGRAIRVNERGFCRVFDFLLLYNKYLYAHSRARLQAAVGMGYKTRVVFPDGQQIEGTRFIASRYRRPKVAKQIGRPVKREHL